MKKNLIFQAAAVSFLLSSCGGSGGGGSGNTTDSTGDGGCTSYADSGYSNGVRIQYGQMPSDISVNPISACSKGQFVFDGQCWDSVNFNDQTGEVDFIQSSQSEVILKPFQTFSARMQNVMSSIQSMTNGVDCVLNPQSDVQIKSCSTDYQMYYDLLNYTNYSVWALQLWGWDHQALGSGAYGQQYAAGESTLSVKTSFGKCANSNSYDWYNNGTFKLNSVSLQLPLSKNQFLSVYSSAANTNCPFNISGWSCYVVPTNWGSESFYFDSNNNLNSMHLSYSNNM